MAECMKLVAPHFVQVIISEIPPCKSYHTPRLLRNTTLVTSHHPEWSPQLPMPWVWPSLPACIAGLLWEHPDSPAQSLRTGTSPHSSGLSSNPTSQTPSCPFSTPTSDAQMKWKLDGQSPLKTEQGSRAVCKNLTWLEVRKSPKVNSEVQEVWDGRMGGLMQSSTPSPNLHLNSAVDLSDCLLPPGSYPGDPHQAICDPPALQCGLHPGFAVLLGGQTTVSHHDKAPCFCFCGTQVFFLLKP